MSVADLSRVDPAAARSAEEFVVLLRQVRAISGLTYWEIEERALSMGYALEPAGVVQALSGDDLPGPHLIIGLLLACGLANHQVDRWMQVYDELSYVEPLAEQQAAPVPHRGRRRLVATRWRRRPIAIAITAAVIVVVAGVALANLLSGPARVTGEAQPSPALTGPDGSAPPESTPSTAPSAHAATTTPGPPAGVLRTGTTTLTSGQGLDLDTGQSSGGLDVVANAGGIHSGDNGKRLALMPAGAAASKQTCGSLVPGRLDRDLSGLSAGQSICVRTTDGRWAGLFITATGSSLKFGYTAWT